MSRDEYIKCQLKIILNKQLYDKNKIDYDTYKIVENNLLNQLLKITKSFENSQETLGLA